MSVNINGFINKTSSTNNTYRKIQKNNESEKEIRQSPDVDRDRIETLTQKTYNIGIYSKNAIAGDKSEKDKPESDIKQTKIENIAAGLKFKDKNDLMSYLKENYKIVADGNAEISESYLSRCLNDESELQKLFDNLAAADQMAADAEENLEGYQGMKVKIDENGEMTTESYGGKVAVNEGKRLRQIAAAKNPAQIQMVLAMLNTDMSDVKRGKEQNMCDDDEIAKVEALMQQAQAKASQIQAENNDESTKEENENDMSFYTTLLM